MEWVVEHSGRSHLSDNADSVIRLRGLPFECTKEDISNFFEGIVAYAMFPTSSSVGCSFGLLFGLSGFWRKGILVMVSCE